MAHQRFNVLGVTVPSVKDQTMERSLEVVQRDCNLLSHCHSLGQS